MDTKRSLTAWLFMVASVLLEVAGTTVMKLSQDEGFLLGPYAGLAAMFALVGLSYYCLSIAVRRLPVGVAFAFWEGMGLTLISVVSVLVLKEEFSPLRLVALAAVLSGVLLINYGTGQGAEPSPGTRHDRSAA